jgi:hypothetical protein
MATLLMPLLGNDSSSTSFFLGHAHPGIKISDFRQNGILILRLSPDWIKIITNIKAKRTNPDDIKTTGAILQDFFATSFPSSIFETLLTPYYVSVWNGNLSHVLFLWSFIKDKNPHIGKCFIYS